VFADVACSVHQSLPTGLPQDQAHADSIKWLKQAAELGVPDAQYAYAGVCASAKEKAELDVANNFVDRVEEKRRHEESYTWWGVAG